MVNLPQATSHNNALTRKIAIHFVPLTSEAKYFQKLESGTSNRDTQINNLYESSGKNT